MRENVLPADHPNLGQSYKNLAALYNDQKELKKAEPLYEKSLLIKTKVCSSSLSYVSRQQDARVRAHFTVQLIAFYPQNYGSDHPHVVSILKNLASIYKKLQKWEKAASLYKQLVEIREKTTTLNSDPSCATALVNLAVIYCHMVSTAY